MADRTPTVLKRNDRSEVPALPRIVTNSGQAASKRFLEFFAVKIRNPNTRYAYVHACANFLDWCEAHHVSTLVGIEPMVVAGYIEDLGTAYARPTVKQHLAAIRKLFDWLVTGHVVAVNPAWSVEGPKHVIKEGLTHVLTKDEARALIDSIDVSTIIGLRDRALIGVMVFAFARVSAVVAMHVHDYFPRGKRWKILLHEKGGKLHQVRCHHLLEEYLDAYNAAAGHATEHESPLFRTFGRDGKLSARGMSRHDAFRMVRRRALAAGLPPGVCCHTFRATGITEYMRNGGTLDKAAAIAAHSSTRTTQLYNRLGDEVSLDEIEKIVI